MYPAPKPRPDRGERGERRHEWRRLAAFVAPALIVSSVLAGPAGAASGDLDASFSGDGLQTATGGPTYVGASVLQPDGKLVVAGTGAYDDGTASKTGTYVVRYTTAGELDPTFGTGGIAKLNAFPGYEAVRDVALDGSGRVVVTGYGSTVQAGDDSDVAVIRLTSAGAPDTTFGGGDGIVTLDLTNHDRTGGVAVTANRIYLGVSQDAGGNFANEWSLVALTNAGALDPTFSGDGIAEVPTTKISIFDGLRDLAVQPDGKVLLGGTAGSTFAVARLTAAGALDPTWDGDGVATAAIGTAAAATSMVLQPDKKVVLAGSTTLTGRSDTDFAAARFTGAGALDKTFGIGGVTAFDLGAKLGDRALAVALAADEKIVLAGSSTTAAGMDLATARLNWNGSLDTSWSGDGLVVTSTLATANEQLEALTVGPNDRIVGAGENLDGWSLAAYAGKANTGLSIADVSRAEGNAGTAGMVFTVKLSVAWSTPVTVKYATKAQTATAGSDFTATSGSLTFAPGETAKTVTVPIVGDTVVEPGETFKVVLSKPTNAGLLRAGATGTIVNDD